MKQGIYSVFDKKAGVYHTPFVSLNDATAIRSFHHVSSHPDSLVADNSEDYSLFRVGIFDDEEGIVSPESRPVWVTNAKPKSINN